jgi:glycosyltransferase involved in cell wall biosynthesis
VQYGSPDYTSPPALSAVPEGRPLRLLFVGRVGQRKGFGYLMQALEKIPMKEVELTVVGEMVGDPQVWSTYRDRFIYHRTMPHSELMWLMRQSDLLVLPTLFEGQALVILEAMKMGVPVLTTPNSGAANLIVDGVNGLIVPIRSAAALEQKIVWAAQHRAELKEMGRKAQGTAEQCTWTAYATAIAEVLT